MSIDKRTGDFKHMSQRAMIRQQARIVSWLVNRHASDNGSVSIPVGELERQDGIEIRLSGDVMTVTVGDEAKR